MSLSRAVAAIVLFALSLCALFASATSDDNAQGDEPLNDGQARRWICVLEKAAGVRYPSGDAKEMPPGAINFEERHKKFVLTIKQIVRSQRERDFCLSNLAYWVPLLSKKGTFSPSSGGDIKKFSDFRANIGPCFASNEATIKFFDRREASRLLSYDFLSNEFVGLPGRWLKLYGNNFEAGESLDLGPVVFTGKCERID